MKAWLKASNKVFLSTGCLLFSAGPLECDLCKFAVTDVKEVVDKNTTVQECEDLLRKVCGVIPDKQLSAEVRGIRFYYVPS